MGGFQSGALEYYADRWDVINLDGVVNDRALGAMKENRMDAYLLEEGIEWMIDLDWIIDALYVRRSGVDDPLGNWTLVHRTGKMQLFQRNVTP